MLLVALVGEMTTLGRHIKNSRMVGGPGSRGGDMHIRVPPTRVLPPRGGAGSSRTADSIAPQTHMRAHARLPTQPQPGREAPAAVLL